MDFLNFLPEQSLIPVSFVSYDREAYYLGDGDEEIRLNFDSNIAIAEVGETIGFEHLVFPDSRVILEVKIPRRGCPQILSQVLALSEAQRTTFSKYATGINVISKLNGMESPNEF